MRILIRIIVIFVSLSDISAQSISELYISDGISKPLSYNDNGVSFGYRTDTQGNLLAFLKIDNSDAYPVGESIRENAGLGKINISPAKLMNIINCSPRKMLSYSLYLSHLDFATKRSSEKILPLNVQILKPYGCKPVEAPPRPKLLSANFFKKQVNPTSVLALIAGGALVTTGIQYRDKYSGMSEDADSARVEKAELVIIFGAVLSLISLLNFHESVPDIDRNNIIKRKNDTLLSNWNFSVAKVKSRNKQIRLTYTIIIN